VTHIVHLQDRKKKKKETGSLAFKGTVGTTNQFVRTGKEKRKKEDTTRGGNETKWIVDENTFNALTKWPTRQGVQFWGQVPSGVARNQAT